jgi:DNA ligase 4
LPSFPPHHTRCLARRASPRTHCSGDEGLIIKKAGSTYTLTSRNNRTKDWLKIKPEYADGGSYDLDCAIVAAYRGTGARRNEARQFSHFLLAVRSDDGTVDADGEEVPNKMLTFAKVGTGACTWEGVGVGTCGWRRRGVPVVA